MASRRTVALCRKSLLVSSAGASLKKRAGLQVLELGEGHQPRSSRSGRARPMRSCPIWPWFGDWALQLLQARPDLLLVGVDLASDRLGDLVRLIESVWQPEINLRTATCPRCAKMKGGEFAEDSDEVTTKGDPKTEERS
jgi:hypothetical protein